MKPSLIDQAARDRLARMRGSLGWLGVVAGVLVLQLLPDLILPVLLPTLLLLAVPEIRTGVWLWRSDHRPERGRALFFAYTAWGVLRWFALGLVAVILSLLLGGCLLQAIAPHVLGYPGDRVLGWLLIRVTLGSLMSVGVMLVLGLVFQAAGMAMARAGKLRLYVSVSVVYAWLRGEYPPPLAVDFVRQTRPRGAMIAALAAMVGFVGWCFAVYWILWLMKANGIDFLLDFWGAVVAILLVPATFVIPYLIGFAVQKWLSRGYRQPTPRDCWGDLYPPADAEGIEPQPGGDVQTSRDSTAIQPGSQQARENPP